MVMGMVASLTKADLVPRVALVPSRYSVEMEKLGIGIRNDNSVR
jgi:hypothetical protein